MLLCDQGVVELGDWTGVNIFFSNTHFLSIDSQPDEALYYENQDALLMARYWTDSNHGFQAESTCD